MTSATVFFGEAQAMFDTPQNSKLSALASQGGKAVNHTLRLVQLGVLVGFRGSRHSDGAKPLLLLDQGRSLRSGRASPEPGGTVGKEFRLQDRLSRALDVHELQGRSRLVRQDRRYLDPRHGRRRADELRVDRLRAIAEAGDEDRGSPRSLYRRRPTRASA